MGKPTDEEVPEELNIEELAKAIEQLDAVGKKLKNSRLADRTIVLLLHDMTKLSKTQIKKVLDALPELKATYLKEA
jgi:hypothetical protein